MPLIPGDRLTPSLRRAVLATFVHRWTHENARQSYSGRCPACVQRERCGQLSTVTLSDGQIVNWHDYHMPLQSDEDWLRAHAFHVTRGGRLDADASHCEPIIVADERTIR